MDTVSQVAGTFFDGVWNLLTKTDFPGLGVNIAAVLVSVLVIRFSIRLLSYLTGFGSSASDYGKAANHIEKIKNAKNKDL